MTFEKSMNIDMRERVNRATSEERERVIDVACQWQLYYLFFYSNGYAIYTTLIYIYLLGTLPLRQISLVCKLYLFSRDYMRRKKIYIIVFFYQYVEISKCWLYVKCIWEDRKSCNWSVFPTEIICLKNNCERKRKRLQLDN